LLKQGTSAPTAFRNEHLKNMDILRKSMQEFLVPSSFLPKNTGGNAGDVAFKLPGACTSAEPADRLALWRKLFYSYVSTELTHIQNRLHHPSYKSRYLESTDADISRLVNLDLSCLPKDPQPPPLVYAQILDAYAMNMVAYVKAKKDGLSADEKERRLNIASRAVAYGLEITDESARHDLNRIDAVFLERVSSSNWVSAQESLQQTSIEVRSASDE
jgi:hypothetical protein